VADLIRLFGGPEYAKLFMAARKRVEESGVESARSMTLESLSDAERTALAGLFGLKRRPGLEFRVDLGRLDAVLRASSAESGLIEVLRALGGPLKDKKALRVSERAAEEALWTDAESTVASRPVLLEWLAEVRSQGLLARAARAASMEERRLLAEGLRVVGLLPSKGTPLAVLAAEATGDAHALDSGRPLGGLVLRAVAKLMGRLEVPTSSAGRRRLWQDVGVLCDPLSPHALVLGLRPLGDGHVDRYLRQSAESGEPVKLTLAQVLRHMPVLPAGEVVRVCENPSVVAVAAERLGSRCPALVCTEGVPTTAVMTLLDNVHQHGASLRFHGDFDWGGLRIANEIFARFEAIPWRFGAREYREAVVAGLGTPGLAGFPVAACWEPELGEVLREVGQAVYEERVVDTLVADLAPK
jgi:uncharacterized protein (TIGR02679 family)